MVTKSRDELYDLVARILSAAGADADNAAITAEHLVRANLSGVDTHGVFRVTWKLSRRTSWPRPPRPTSSNRREVAS